MVPPALHGLPIAAHLEERHHADGVEEDGHDDGEQPHQGEDQGEHLVHRLWCDAEKTPGLWVLQLVVAQTHDGQDPDEASKRQDQKHGAQGPPFGHVGGPGEGSVNPHEPLDGHGGSQQQRTKPKEDHGQAHEVAKVAVGIHLFPDEFIVMVGEDNGACHQQTGKISDHQAAEEDEEGGARAALGSPVGSQEHTESKEVGGEAEAGEDGGEQMGSDGIVQSDYGRKPGGETEA